MKNTVTIKPTKLGRPTLKSNSLCLSDSMREIGPKLTLVFISICFPPPLKMNLILMLPFRYSTFIDSCSTGLKHFLLRESKHRLTFI